MRTERGFSLVELMVAMTVTLIVSGAIYGLLTSGSNAFRREPDTARATGRRMAITASMRTRPTCARSWPRSAGLRCWGARCSAASPALIAAGEAPRLATPAIVLVDVTPRIDPGGRERIMKFMRSQPEGFASVEEAADAVSAFLPHRPGPADVSGLAKNLRRDADGRYRWHWDPAFMSASKLGKDTMNPERFEDAARTIDAPTLLVRGGKSEIVSAEGVAAFQKVMPHAEYVDVPEARHMVAGDQNDVFSFAVVEFLTRTVAAAGRNEP